MDLNPLISKVKAICRANGVVMPGVFGSVAKGEDTPSSDVDLLVKLSKPIGLVEFISLEDTFSQVFNRRVDLVTESSLHPLIRQGVLADLRVIYEK